jgi:hypothetical protein
MSVCELNRNSLQVFIPCGEFSFDLLKVKDVVQHTDPYFGKPYGGFWTSTLDGDFATAWSDFLCSDFTSRNVGSKAAVFSIAPNAKIYDIKNVDAYYELMERYPLETEKGTLLDWVAISQDFDAVHASCYFPRYWDIESTVWFNLDALIFEGTIGIKEERYIDEYDWNVRKLKLIPEPWMQYELVKVGEIDRGYYGTRDITQIHLRKNPSGHDILFHGSSKKLKAIKPQKHYLADNRPVVFGTPLLEVALTFLHPWTDDDFTQGIVDDEPLHMIEQYPNAFEDIFEGASGYIYVLDGEPFYSQDNLTRYELISDTAPTILETIYIEDALQALKESDIQMIKFEDKDRFVGNHSHRHHLKPLFLWE